MIIPNKMCSWQKHAVVNCEEILDANNLFEPHFERRESLYPFY